MKLFIDSAHIEEIKQAAALGVCDGVTTNPTLIAKGGVDFKTVIQQICTLIPGPISAEVVAVQAEGMVAEGTELARMHANVVVKLPLTQEGLKACKRLTEKGIRTNVTLCFQAGQALLAAKAGATYVSAFVGRLDDCSEDGMQLVRDIRTLYGNYSFQTEILVASVRHPRHVIDAALAGAHVATLPLKVLQQLYAHPLTDKGLASFLEDWKNSGQKPLL